MLNTIDINNPNLKIYYAKQFKDACESNAYLANYKDNYKVVKIFLNENSIKNKINKMNLLKERLKDTKEIITADAFITDKDKIIGYMMPFVYGKKIHDIHLNKGNKLWYLKELSSKLKKLHDLNIAAIDFNENTLITLNEKIYLIDHDNFAIDNYKPDKKNIFLTDYEKCVKTFDKHFDDYLLNIHTIALINNIADQYLSFCYKQNKDKFNFKDSEINSIFYNTMNLGPNYNEGFIIDKINDIKDLKKIKVKL